MLRRCAIVLACWVSLALPAAAQLSVGDPAPPIELESLLQAPGGSQASLESLKGKVIVLDFWATWCAPCLRSMPHLNQLVTELKDDPVVFIAVTNEREAMIKSFLKQRQLSAWVGIDANRSMFRDYRISGIPRTYIIDPAGKIAGTMHPMNLNAQMLRDLVAGKAIQMARAGSRNGAVMSQQAARARMPLVMLDIRPSAQTGQPSFGMRPGQVVMIGAPLAEVFARAYQVPLSDVVGDADKLAERYDVMVRTPPSAGNELELLRTGLAAAIGLDANVESREREVYLLEKACEELGPRLKPTALTQAGKSVGSSGNLHQFANVSLDELADWLSRRTDRPVVNVTQLDGRYDAELELANVDLEALQAELKSKLCLRMRLDKHTSDVLVIAPSAGK